MDRPESARFAQLLRGARRLIAEERFLNWQAALPGLWTNWQSADLEGGFDAVIGKTPHPHRFFNSSKPFSASARSR